MGMLYDYTDSNPSSVAQMSALSNNTAGAVWTGSLGAQYLKGNRRALDAGAIVCSADISRFQNNWYPYCTLAQLTTAVGVNAVLGNSYSPFDLVVATSAVETAAAVGKLYMSYDIELIEPIPSALQSSATKTRKWGFAPPSLTGDGVLV